MSSIPPIRKWAARKAAERVMHWTALAGEPTDPYVLARLGLYPLALKRPAVDSLGEFGRNIAKVALGEADKATRKSLESLPPWQRNLAAKLLALQDCTAASGLLDPGNYLARAACHLALGEPRRALDLLDPSPERSREIAALRASVAVGVGDYVQARQAFNAMFGHDGLSLPLNPGAGPYSVDDLNSQAKSVAEGPKVSVIVPYHNAEATLETAVRSMKEQSWRDIELLLVDDRSTDRSPVLAKRFAESDDRILALTNMRNPGVYGARNTAIDAAKGTYVAFLDADDWSPAERIARQVEFLGGHVAAMANHIRMDEAGRPVAPRIFPIVRPVPITVFLRRETLIAAGPFEEVMTGADTEMLGRLEMIHGKRAISRDKAVLLVARWQSGSLSRDTEGGLFGRERYDYRAEWMFRHAGLAAPRLPKEQSAE